MTPLVKEIAEGVFLPAAQFFDIFNKSGFMGVCGCLDSSFMLLLPSIFNEKCLLEDDSMANVVGEGKRSPNNVVCVIRRALIVADDVVHVIVAVALLISALFMLLYTAGNFGDMTVSSILLVINDVLFVLIIMELLWTVIRYLKRQEFSLKPFLAIGIISSLRRILMLEAQMSMSEHSTYYPLVEVGISTAIVFVLVVAYYLVNKVEASRETKKES